MKSVQHIPDMMLSHLSPRRRQLVELAQRLGFGTVHGLAVRGGDPVSDPPPRVLRRRKNGPINVERHRSPSTDFALKHEWVAFFRDLDEMGDGTIALIEIAHGLPILHEFEEKFAF